MWIKNTLFNEYYLFEEHSYAVPFFLYNLIFFRFKFLTVKARELNRLCLLEPTYICGWFEFICVDFIYKWSALFEKLDNKVKTCSWELLYLWCQTIQNPMTIVQTKVSKNFKLYNTLFLSWPLHIYCKIKQCHGLFSDCRMIETGRI